MRIGINARQILACKDGIGYYAHYLIKNLASFDRHNEYVIFSPQRLSFDFGNKNFKNNAIKFPAGNKLFRGFWENFLLPLECECKKIDLLHCLAHTFPFVFKGKRVLTIHDIAFMACPQIIPKHLYFYYRNFICRAAASADKIIAISRHTQEDLRRLLGVPLSKIKVIHQGVSPIFKPLDSGEHGETIKKKYYIRNRFILYVGSLVKRKNLKRLIQVYSVLKKTKKIDHQLILAGGKGYPYPLDIFKLVKELNLGSEVIFTGYIPEGDILALYNCAELFIYPSLYEGFGLPVIEAMACGCPVVTSANSSLLEIAKDAAIFIDPYNPDEIAKGMYQGLTDNRLRNDLVKKGLARAKQFCWENTARQTLDAYREVLNKFS